MHTESQLWICVLAVSPDHPVTVPKPVSFPEDLCRVLGTKGPVHKACTEMRISSALTLMPFTEIA